MCCGESAQTRKQKVCAMDLFSVSTVYIDIVLIIYSVHTWFVHCSDMVDVGTFHGSVTCLTAQSRWN